MWYLRGFLGIFKGDFWGLYGRGSKTYIRLVVSTSVWKQKYMICLPNWGVLGSSFFDPHFVVETWSIDCSAVFYRTMSLLVLMALFQEGFDQIDFNCVLRESYLSCCFLTYFN